MRMRLQLMAVHSAEAMESIAAVATTEQRQDRSLLVTRSDFYRRKARNRQSIRDTLFDPCGLCSCLPLHDSSPPTYINVHWINERISKGDFWWGDKPAKGCHGSAMILSINIQDLSPSMKKRIKDGLLVW